MNHLIVLSYASIALSSAMLGIGSVSIPVTCPYCGLGARTHFSSLRDSPAEFTQACLSLNCGKEYLVQIGDAEDVTAESVSREADAFLAGLGDPNPSRETVLRHLHPDLPSDFDFSVPAAPPASPAPVSILPRKLELLEAPVASPIAAAIKATTSTIPSRASRRAAFIAALGLA